MCRHDHERVAHRRRPAGQAGAAPPSHERPIVLRRDADRSGELCAGVRETHGGGRAAVHPCVTLVERELERLGARSARPERCLQIGYERADVGIAFDM
jgi:hypothetical protein